MAVSRRTVTILFADIADSTALGEKLDPEALRGVMAQWFDAARTAIEGHGGTVEKFIGDAVMGAFGAPEAHEDDAVRAVRAAVELRERLAGVNAEVERDFGVRIAIRIGVNTGEVVAGDPRVGHAFLSGDAVNTAKRLEEAAGAAEILLGAPTERLVRGAALLEPAGTLTAKGKSLPVDAWRLLAAIPGIPAVARRFDTPFVGRDAELGRLRQAYERASQERTCCLFTLLGPAGIGKSRLASELFAELGDDASVLVGRCLPYGDGITFWPLTEILREVGGEEALSALLDEDAELVTERLSGVKGRAPATSTQETFWAVRKLCEALARRQPLVLCFEDVHWAEPTMLDLIEYLAGWIRDAPILLLCIARPEFLDERPAWLSGMEHAASLTLQPLSRDESEALLDALGTDGDRTRIADAAEGNPLYVEQMAAMVAEGGSLDVVPPTIQALLAARLDRLSPVERRAIERAAVAGREFWSDAVVELTPEDERTQVGSTLMSLVRKELIRPQRSSTRSDDAFRFAHVLIRDAAYAAIPKETRAALHERFAGWVETSVRERALELEEIVGYHYEQAFRYREQLGPLDQHAHDLAQRAGEVLGSAGRRALARGDMPAAASLLERATSLLPDDAPFCRVLLVDLGTVRRETGRLADADETLQEAARRAEASSDRLLGLHARLEQAVLHVYTYPERGTDELLRVADSIIPAFQELGDDRGVARAWLLVADAYWVRGRIRAMEEALDRALRHAESGSPREQLAIWNGIARAALAGPTPVPEAIGRCREIAAQAPPDRSLEAVLATITAYLEAMRGRFPAARELYASSQATLADLGKTVILAALQTWSGAVEVLAGDPYAAEAELRSAFETLEPMGERANLATIAAALAGALYMQGRDDDAAELTRLSERLASHDDVTSQIQWRAVRAKVLARQGQPTEGERLARESVSLAVQTDCPNLHGDSLLSLGETLVHAERETEARTAFAQAGAVYEAKGNSVMAAAAAAAAERVGALNAERVAGTSERVAGTSDPERR